MPEHRISQGEQWVSWIPSKILTSSFVVDELRDGEHHDSLSYINSGRVEDAIITAEEFEDFESLRRECEAYGLSPADSSVLYLARREQALLITGDKQLRRVADEKEVEFHGTLWILESLIHANILPATIAADRLQQLLSRTGTERRYLPKQECESRIKKWRRSNNG